MDGLGFLLLNVEQLGCYSVAACWRSSEELARSWEQMLLIGLLQEKSEIAEPEGFDSFSRPVSGTRATTTGGFSADLLSVELGLICWLTLAALINSPRLLICLSHARGRNMITDQPR
jgi:hypothetical protein